MKQVNLTCRVLWALAVAAFADKVVLKSGETLHGKVIDDGGARVTVQVSEAIRLRVPREQILRIVPEDAAERPGRPAAAGRDAPPRPQEPPGDANGGSTDPGEDKPPVVCFAQIAGPIDSWLLVGELRRGCQRARGYGASVIVFEVDTPGGRLDLTQEIAALIETLAPIRAVAYVCGGPEGGAFSAGAVVAVCCDQTFMAPGTAIGAAAPIRVTRAGVSPVGEKTVSAVTARVRSLAQKNHYPAEIVAAMVDANIELRRAKVAGRETYLSVKAGLKEQPAPKVELGEFITKRGKLLTLTALEAKQLKVAAGVVASRQKLAIALGLGKARLITLNTAQALREALARREKVLRKLDAKIASYEAKAKAIDPAKFTYPRLVKGQGFKERGDFIDGGRLWRRRSDSCLRLADACLQACRSKLVLARRYPELGIKTSALEAKMTELLGLRTRVQSDRGRHGGER